MNQSVTHESPVPAIIGCSKCCRKCQSLQADLEASHLQNRLDAGVITQLKKQVQQLESALKSSTQALKDITRTEDVYAGSRE